MGFLARLLTLSRAPDNDDAPFFIRGVQRFSVPEGRPHWPGYPVYIAAGKLARWVVGDPAFALQVVSAAASAAIAWLAARVVAAWAESLGASPRDAARAGLTASLLWLVSPMSWVTGIQIISDPLGLLLGLAIVALAIRGERRGEAWPWLAAAFVAGAMIGVRLVNVSMLGPLLWKAWSARRERWPRLPAVAALALALGAGLLPWISWLALHDLAAYVQAGRLHLGGHFTRYGESIWTDPHPWQRPWIALRTLAVYGLGFGGPGLGWARALSSAGWVATLLVAARLRPWRGTVWRLVALWAIPHLAYVFLAHDVAYGRYALSATLMVALFAGLAGSGAGPAGWSVPLVTAVAVMAVSLPVAVHQARQPPVEYQALRHVARQPAPGVVLVSRADDLLVIYAPLFEERVRLVRVPVERVGTVRERAPAGHDLYVTAVPPTDSAGWVPVGHFCRDPMIEPLIASELWLFRAGPPDADAPLPACGEER